ncbi:MAG: endonuclease/exonuclease/phosphatase family protein [Brumimicrobium sp.]
MAKLRQGLIYIIKWIFVFTALILALGLTLSYLSPFISPEDFWWIQLFGLAYPIMFFSAAILTIVFLYFNRKISFLLGIILLLGIPIHLRFFSFSSNQEPISSDSNTVSVMSYNVRLFDMYKWVNNDSSTSKKGFINAFKKAQPDVLCLQEYVEDNRKLANITKNDIMEAGGFKYMTQKVTVQTKFVNFGLAVYSKYPIINEGVIKSTNNDMSCLFIDILKKKDTIRFYNTHLQSIRLQQDEYSIFDEKSPTSKSKLKKIYGLIGKLKNAYKPRLKQVSGILKHAEKCHYPMVFCGDFNDPPISYIYGLFNEKYHDAFRAASYGIGKTYAGKIPAGRIDYIFYNEKLNALNFERQNDIFSDHYAIWSTMEVK